MRRILICSGVLGGGTALVFTAAALTSMLIPPTRIVPQSPNVLLDSRMPANIGGQLVTISGTGAARGPDVFVTAPILEATP